MASAQVAAAMTPGEERPLHSFFTNSTRRKVPEPTQFQRNNVGHLTDPPIAASSSSKANVNTIDSGQCVPEVYGNEHEPSIANTEYPNACNVASDHNGEYLPSAHHEKAISGHHNASYQPCKRRKVEAKQTTLSWDEQLRSYAEGAFDGSTKNSDAIYSMIRPVDPESEQESAKVNRRHSQEENKSRISGNGSELHTSLLPSRNQESHNSGEASTEGGQPDVPLLGEKATSDGEKSSTSIRQPSGKEQKPLQYNSKGKLVFPGMPSSESSSKKGQDYDSGRHTRGKTHKQLIVAIPYGKDKPTREEIASRIDAILSSSQINAKATSQVTSSKLGSEARGKALHPFFLPGKGRQTHPSGHRDVRPPNSVNTSDEHPRIERKRNSCATTPGKLRAQARAMQSNTASAGIQHRDGTDEKRFLRHLGPPGALWPSRDTAHVRGPLSNLPRPSTYEKTRPHIETLEPKQRKKKDGVLAAKQHRQLSFAELTRLDANALHTLKLPERLVISGKELQRLVSKELMYNSAKTKINRSQESISNVAQRPNSYPRFVQDYERISSALTPFDQGLREAEPWSQKYAPCSAEEVLQSGTEPFALREWLKTLAVQAVDKGRSNDGRAQSSRKEETTRTKKKKRRKRDDIDDFIVSSDDENDMMEHVEDARDEDAQAPGSGHSKSIFRVGDLASTSKARMTNAVLLSGPHGCGKTAAVYAVAKELGYEVFELNPGSRRGGKELLEKVGDMAENHLYQSSTADDPSSLSADEETARLGKALEKDLSTGRQGTMTSFFAPKPSTAPKTSKAVRTNAKKKETPRLPPPPSQNSSKQKQSLILLEEVDVLFEEDKQFWLSLATLAASSKRPIIMTCNDENLVPLDSLNLHAILRCSPPTLDMVTDYLLLMAANEGHVLRRSAVSDLFVSRQQDLRATIQQLDFWCQMGIGDKKGGLEWIYQRWPPGKDSDADGNRLRVVSQDTFIESSSSRFVVHNNRDLHSTNDDRVCKPVPSSARNELEVLEDLELAFDGRSAADIFSQWRSASEYKDALDPTEPQMDEAERADFIEGYQLVQADLRVKFTDTDLQLFTFTTTCADSILDKAGMQNISMSDRALLNEEPTGGPNLNITSIEENQDQPLLQHRHLLTALEPLADPGAQAALQSLVPGASVLDGTLAPIIEDVAPYVRSIVSFDLALEEQRLQRSNLLSQGGRQAKKARLTRASRSALEGGKREFTRRDRWFTKSLNAALVLRTAGHGWTVVPEVARSRATSDEPPDLC